MKLWTIQTEQAYQSLLQKGTLIGDWRRVWKSFKPAYRWMCIRMERENIKLPGSEKLEGKPPIWAWPTKPDLRGRGHVSVGVKAVRIEFNAPDSLCLASNFEAWHFVLNNWYLPQEGEDQAGGGEDEYYLLDIRESWKRIFQPEKLKQFSPNQQVCLPYVKREWIVRTTDFVGR